jgi:hypothetical protein
MRKGATSQAFVKLNGEWQKAQDWTELPLRFFCRDRRAQRIDELVLVVSNSEWQDRSYVLEPSGKAPLVAANNVGCIKWEGTITHKANSAYKEYPDFSNTTVVAKIAFEVVPMSQEVDPELQLFAAHSFNAVGRISFEEVYERYAGMPPLLECGGEVIGSEALNDGYLRIGAASFPDSSLGRAYDGEGTTFMDFTLPACEDGNEQNVEVSFFRMPEGDDSGLTPPGGLAPLVDGPVDRPVGGEGDRASDAAVGPDHHVQESAGGPVIAHEPAVEHIEGVAAGGLRQAESR